MPAFGVLRAHFHGRLQVFAIKLVDEARFANTGSADEGDGVALLDLRRKFFDAAPGERTDGQHQRIACRARGLGELGFKVVAQINFVEDDHRARAAFAAHDEHALHSRGVKGRVGGGHKKNGFDVRGEDLHGGIAAAGLANNLRAARQDGLNHGLFLIGNELDGNPIADLGKNRVIAA